MSTSPLPSPQVVVVKNFPLRRSITGFMAPAYFLLTAALFTLPLMLLVKDPGWFMVGALVATALAELATIFWCLRYNGQSWREGLALRLPKWWQLLVGVGAGALLLLGLQGLGWLTSTLGMPLQSSDTSVGVASLQGIPRVLALYLLVPFLVPLVEELFFRGLLMGSFLESSFASKWRVPLALLVPAGAFALAHFQGLSSPTDFLLLLWVGLVGLVAGFLRLRWKSLWVPVALHVAYNGFTVVLMLMGL